MQLALGNRYRINTTYAKDNYWPPCWTAPGQEIRIVGQSNNPNYNFPLFLALFLRPCTEHLEHRLEWSKLAEVGGGIWPDYAFTLIEE